MISSSDVLRCTEVPQVISSCGTSSTSTRSGHALRVCVAFLLELTKVAKPVELPRLRCNTRRGESSPSFMADITGWPCRWLSPFT